MAETKSKVKAQKAKVVKKVVKKTTVKKTVVAKVAVKKPLVKETGLKLSVYDIKGKAVESISLSKEIFGVKINNQLMAQAVRVFLFHKDKKVIYQLFFRLEY